MATVVDARSEARSGLVLAVAVILGLLALVVANFAFNRQGLPTASDSSYRVPITAPAPSSSR
jgi:hypothetical protein